MANRVLALKNLPAFLIQQRKAQKLSQTRLAELVGVPASVVCRWESVEYQQVHFYRLVQVAKALGVKLKIHASEVK